MYDQTFTTHVIRSPILIQGALTCYWFLIKVSALYPHDLPTEPIDPRSEAIRRKQIRRRGKDQGGETKERREKKERKTRKTTKGNEGREKQNKKGSEEINPLFRFLFIFL